jgi:hypothetical protein
VYDAISCSTIQSILHFFRADSIFVRFPFFFESIEFLKSTDFQFEKRRFVAKTTPLTWTMASECDDDSSTSAPAGGSCFEYRKKDRSISHEHVHDNNELRIHHHQQQQQRQLMNPPTTTSSHVLSIREFFLVTLTSTPFVKKSVNHINALLRYAKVPEKSLLTNEEFVLSSTAVIVTLVGYYILFGKRHRNKRKRLAEELRLAQRQVRYQTLFSFFPSLYQYAYNGAFQLVHHNIILNLRFIYCSCPYIVNQS